MGTSPLLGYHVSPRENRERILDSGLRARTEQLNGTRSRQPVFRIRSQPDALYFCDDPSGSDFYINYLWLKFQPNPYGCLHDLDVWQISLDGSEQLEPDGGWVRQGAFRCFTDIPPEQIQLLVTLSRSACWDPVCKWRLSREAQPA